MELNFFTSDQLQWVGFISLVTTLIVSAINVTLKKNDGTTSFNGKWLALIVAPVITVLKTTFTKGMLFAEWQVVLTNGFLAIAVSILFWTYVGQYTVDKIFGWIKKKLAEKFPTDGTVPPNEKP
jgi:hypothetical protein